MDSRTPKDGQPAWLHALPWEHIPSLLGVVLTVALAVLLYFKFDEKVSLDVVIVAIGAVAILTFEVYIHLLQQERERVHRTDLLSLVEQMPALVEDLLRLVRLTAEAYRAGYPLAIQMGLRDVLTRTCDQVA